MTWEDKINSVGIRYAETRVNLALSAIECDPPQTGEARLWLQEAAAMLRGLDEKQMRMLRVLLNEV